MTLGLSMITNDAEATIKILEKYGQYFDKWFITVADKDKKQHKLLSEQPLQDKLELSYFKWCNNFAKAREYNREQIDTDCAFWMDSDDSLSDPDQLRVIAGMMEHEGLDLVQLKYEYAKNEHGESVGDHWRERFWRVGHDVKWEGAVHETLITPNAHTKKVDALSVIHHKDLSDATKAIERNKKILEIDFKNNKDPRTAHYLGLTYMSEGNYEKAIQFFLLHIQTSGWDEEQYRSWCKVAECEFMMDRYPQALAATNGAVDLLPDYPDAYYIKVLVYGSMEQYKKAIEWLKVAQSKPEPDTLSIVDPTLYKYRGLAMGAQCYLFSGKVKEAFAMYQEVMKRAPHFFDKEWQALFEQGYYDQKAVEYSRFLLEYARIEKGKPTKIFEALPFRLFADPRLNNERVKFYPKKKWPKGSIAYFCGQAAETWGPDTLDKGMGGSEEAVVYLSRELAKLGHEVTVFNDREEEYFDDINQGVSPTTGEYNGVFKSVAYKPWTLLNPYDEFDIFIAWRMPEHANGVKARKIFVDLHDTVDAKRVYNCAENVDKFFVKSKYHRSLYPKLPDDKFVIIGNAIVKEQFND